VSLVKMYSFAVIGKHPIQIANVALVGDSKLAFALGGCNRLKALCADRVDGGITILPSGEGDNTGHSAPRGSPQVENGVWLRAAIWKH
jgi:hypothetical protein